MELVTINMGSFKKSCVNQTTMDRSNIHFKSNQDKTWMSLILTMDLGFEYATIK